MRRGWNLRIKILVLTMGVVVPIMVLATAVTVRMSGAALEDDIRSTALALARELAASAAADRGAAGEQAIRQGVPSLFGKGGVVRDVAVYATRPEGLVARAFRAAAAPAARDFPRSSQAAEKGDPA
jgi:hypothetical protein